MALGDVSARIFSHWEVWGWDFLSILSQSRAPNDGGSGYPVAVSPPCWHPLSLAVLCDALEPPAQPTGGAADARLGLASSISSELCSAQQILGFLFHQAAVMSTFAWAAGGGFGPAASSPGRCSAQGFTRRAQTETPTRASTHQQLKSGWGCPEPSLGAGPCSSQPNLARGRTSTSVSAWVRRQERCPWWYRGLCPAQQPWDHLLRAAHEGDDNPDGTWNSWGDRGGCLGALGVFSGCADDGAQVWLGAVWI